MQLIGLGVEHRHGFSSCAMQSPGVDDARTQDGFITSDVRVAVEKIIDLKLIAGPFESALVAVVYGDPFAVEFQTHRNLIGRVQAHHAEVFEQAVLGKVGVSPYEGAWPTDQFVEHVLPADVAAMNEIRHIELTKELDRLSYRAMVSMAV